jgi:nucleobase transporter 1/2
MSNPEDESMPNKEISDTSIDLKKPETGEEGKEEPKLTYREKALKNGIKYTVTDVPPLPQAIMLGVQHYLTMLGATVLIPLILCPAMGASGSQTAEVISSIFFVSGIATLIQTSIGDRYVVFQIDTESCYNEYNEHSLTSQTCCSYFPLSVYTHTRAHGYSLPIVQGGSFSYLPATFGIIFNAELQAIEDPSERFERTMRTIQGAIIVSGIIQIFIGFSGMVPILLRYISPVTIAPVIAAIGLGLYGVGFSGVSACWSLGLTQLLTIVVFSQ